MIGKRISRILLVLGLVGFTLGFMGNVFWVFDTFSHFRIYFLFYFLTISISSLLIRRRKEAFISLLFFGYCSISILKFYVSKNHEEVDLSVKIVSINLLSRNNDYQRVIDFLEIEDPEIILLQELNQTWQNELSVQLSKYNYQLVEPRWDNFGIAMASKLPSHIELKYFGMAGVPSIVLTAKLESDIVQIIGTHPLPPISADYFYMRNIQFDDLNNFIQNQPTEIILLGDFNSSSFSPSFTKITSKTDLKDSRIGFGLQPSWNAMISWLAVTIDHALVSERIIVTDRRLGPDIGSDHYPVILEFGIEN